MSNHRQIRRDDVIAGSPGSGMLYFDATRVVAVARTAQARGLGRLLRRGAGGFARSVKALAGAVALAWQRQRDASRLAAMSDHLLADIGLTRMDIAAYSRGRTPQGEAEWTASVAPSSAAPLLAPQRQDGRDDGDLSHAA